MYIHSFNMSESNFVTAFQKMKMKQTIVLRHLRLCTLMILHFSHISLQPIACWISPMVMIRESQLGQAQIKAMTHGLIHGDLETYTLVCLIFLVDCAGCGNCG